MHDFYVCFASGMIEVFILCSDCTNAHVLMSKDTNIYMVVCPRTHLRDTKTMINK